MLAPPPRHHPLRLGVSVFFVVVLIAAVAALSDATGVIALVALAPPSLFAALALALDRRRPRLWYPALAALGWGATIAALGALAVNDAALREWPAAWVTSLVGPLVEEIAKGSALALVVLAWPGALCGVREGILYGALAGLGFAATENLGYYTLAAVQGGTPGLARALYLRGLLQGLNHAAFTAIIGAAVGRARRDASAASRRRVVALGFAAAVAVHAAWNVFASPAITTLLCNAPSSGAACSPEPRSLDLFLGVPAIIAAFMGPVAALLVILVLRERREP